VVDEARHQSTQIIENSEKKAAEIVINAEFFSAETQKELNQKVEEATRKHINEYEELLKTFRADVQKTFAKVSADLETEATQELNHFRENIQTQTSQTKTALDSQLAQNQASVEKAIATYKAEMLKKIDQQAYTVIKEAAQSVAPNLWSNKEQEALVTQALETAKQHNAI
jgi:hypothetical protein